MICFGFEVEYIRNIIYLKGWFFISIDVSSHGKRQIFSSSEQKTDNFIWRNPALISECHT